MSYTVDSWLVRDYDYGFVTISLAKYGEPAIAPFGLSATVSCHNTEGENSSEKKIVLPEVTVCELIKYTFNNDNKNLIIQFIPLDIKGNAPKCGHKEMRELNLKKFCKLLRSPAAKSMSLKKTK